MPDARREVFVSDLVMMDGAWTYGLALVGTGYAAPGARVVRFRDEIRKGEVFSVERARPTPVDGGQPQ